MPEIYSWIDARGYRPSLAVFDAQNEGKLEIYDDIITLGREYDLQHRPWDNGWRAPVGENDPIECHPYIIGDNGFYGLSQMEKYLPVVTTIDLGWKVEDYLDHPFILNEHGEYWISRDGQPMSVLNWKWEKILPDSTPEERLTYYADLMAAQIELFRSGRAYSGIQFFCGLTSSPVGAHGITCDILAPDVSTAESLQIRPYTKERLHDAFADLGISVNYFEDRIRRGSKQVFPVTLINDTGEDVTDLPVTLMFKSGDTVLYKEVVTMSVKAFEGGKTGIATKGFTLTIPAYRDYCDNKDVITFSASYEMDGDVISCERSFALLGGSYTEGKPPVYEEDTTVETETGSGTEIETEQETEIDTAFVGLDTESATESGSAETGVTGCPTTSGCKSVLPAVGLLIPAAGALLFANKKRRK
jgi:hypothetical protein